MGYATDNRLVNNAKALSSNKQILDIQQSGTFN